jgi:hypothetical protein
VRASENAANTAAGDLRFSQFGVGIGASWELDFWGRFRRGIEAADAAFLASVADYDQAMILLTAQVCRSYLAIRTLEEQLAITRSNIAIQQRSLDIVNVRFENGSSSELDVLQARTLLLSTQASVPALETSLYQARHALANLLGLPPTDTATCSPRRALSRRCPGKSAWACRRICCGSDPTSAAPSTWRWRRTRRRSGAETSTRVSRSAAPWALRLPVPPIPRAAATAASASCFAPTA